MVNSACEGFSSTGETRKETARFERPGTKGVGVLLPEGRAAVDSPDATTTGVLGVMVAGAPVEGGSGFTTVPAGGTTSPAEDAMPGSLTLTMYHRRLLVP